MTELVLLLAAGLLVLANAFFVASEFAIVKIRPTRLEQLVRQGDPRARRALAITGRLDEYLSANQLGITLASLALGWIGEPSIARLLLPLLTSLGGWASASAHAIAATVAFTAITALHTVVGELAPKSLAIQRTERVTLATARPLHAFFVVCWPLIYVLNAMANTLVRAFGLRPVQKEELAHTTEELKLILSQSPAALDRDLRGMLVRIFDLRRRTARHVMALGTEAATLRADMPIAEAVCAALDAGYSRYPVLDDAGKVLGYLHVRDLFAVLAGRRQASRVAELIRKPIFAHETTSVERLRREMQARQIPVAIVTSGAGEFLGLVTIEDVLEEIVGEIRDENDEEVPPIQARGGGIVDVDGRVLLTDLAREASVTLEPEVKDVETVGGYVLARLGRPAAAGERVECDGCALLVVDVVGRRVRRVRVVPTRDRRDATPGSIARSDRAA